MSELVDVIDLEHRLTTIELTIKNDLSNLKDEISSLSSQVGKQNGRIGNIELWQANHAVELARRDGIQEGKSSLSKMQFTLLMAMLTASGIISAVLAAWSPKLFF